MTEDTKTEIFNIIRPLFRQDALVNIREEDGRCFIGAAWRLGRSPMDNWSREIRLVISREVVDRFGKLNSRGRSKASANLVSFVRVKLSDFHPDHDKPRYVLPPVEEWNVRFEDIFPK